MPYKDKEKQKAYSHAHYEAHKTYRTKAADPIGYEKRRLATLKWKLADPERAQQTSIRAMHKHAHGEPYENKAKRIAEQGGRCANPGCRTKNPGQNGWHTDHDHETNEIRGELCANCNMALGLLHDDELRIDGLAEYIRRYKTLIQKTA